MWYSDVTARKASFMRVIILVIVFVFGGIIFFTLENQKQNKIEEVGLEDLNLQLTGIIDTIDEGDNYHGYGIIRVKIISSNVEEYDPRSKQEFYFCIIKNGMAEIYDHTPTNYSKGDTLMYNTKEKLGSFLRNGKKEQEGTISINANNDYYNYIKRKTMFKQ
jgi:hypothetical protein